MENKRNHRNGERSTKSRGAKLRLTLGGLMLLGMGGATSSALAQQFQGDLGGAKMPEKVYLTKSSFMLPVIVDDRARPTLREVHLYAKEGPGGNWQLANRVPPSETGFKVNLPQDGEYWFSVVTIDNTGMATPQDVTREAPAMIVVLDTANPRVDLKPMPATPDGGIGVRCDVKDANPNPGLTKFEYQTRDRVWRLLDGIPNQPDCFCIPSQAMLSGMVKVTCIDRAMNATVKEFNLDNILTVAAESNPGQKQGFQPAVHTEPGKSLNITQQPTTIGGGNVDSIKQAPPTAIKQQGQLPTQSNDVSAGTSDVQNMTQFSSGAARPAAKPAAAKCLIVNQPRISLDYRIDDEGKSGIGKVDVWITRDMGKNWEIHCDDADKKSPAVFDLPGEGLFGIRLSVTNNRGFGANPPKGGDAPDYLVELDTTKPAVELREVKLATPEESVCMDITWQASDKNLGPAPVDIYYSGSQQGPWTPIAKAVANNGKYRWYLPRELGSQAFIRLVVTDVAGNASRCETSQAVPLDDGGRIQATIINVVPASQFNPPSGGGN